MAKTAHKLTQPLWLMLPLALVVAPHAPALPVWLTAAWAGLAAWRLWRAVSGQPVPPGWLRAVIALGGLAAVFAQFGTVVGPQAGVALLVFLSAAKLMETDTPRDRAGLVFVGYFLLVAHFLNEQSLLTAAYMLFALTALTAALVASQMSDARVVWPVLRQSGLLLLQALPLALLLFVLFPRLSGPLWGLPQQGMGQTGLSDQMSPGEISRLIQSDAIAFRADFTQFRPDARSLYWRGPVLWDYAGRTWRTSRPIPAEPVQGQGLGKAQRYSVTLEPHNNRWLFLLGLPQSLPPLDAQLGADLQWLSRTPVTSRLQYNVSAYLDYRLGLDLSPEVRARALALPQGSNPRARDLARRWAAEPGGDRAVVEQALVRFREEPYAYTLNPPPLGDQAVDDFLFGSRRGFCEHYASAFVFLMRAAGIPARVVTGYQGGEYNAVGDYWIVRSRDAHAWAEVWLEGRGWVRVDPTAAVSPARVERGVTAALPFGERPGALMGLDAGWLASTRLAWDTLNHRWNLWVLGYNDARQRQLLAGLSPHLVTLRGMLWSLAIGVTVLVFGLAALLLLRRRERDVDPVSRSYGRFCRRLARLGLVRRPGEGAVDFARRVAALRPELAPAVGRITGLYVGLRYGHAPAEAARDFRDAVRRFRPSRRHGRPGTIG